MMGGGPLRRTASPTDGFPSRGRLYGGTGSAELDRPGSPRYAARSPALLPVPAVAPLPLRGVAVPVVADPLPPLRAEPPRSPAPVREPPPPPPDTCPPPP